MYSRYVEQVLTPRHVSLASWKTPRPTIVSMQLSAALDASPAAPASHLPRIHVKWGTDRATHQIIADLPRYATLAMIGDSFSIEGWSEQDDTTTPTAQTTTSPIYRINLTAIEGKSVDSTRLTYTTRSHTMNTDFQSHLPDGAVEVWTMHVAGPSPGFAPALPPGYLLVGAVHTGAGAGGVQVYQRFDVNEILNRPQPISPLAIGGHPGSAFIRENNYVTFYPHGAAPAHTETFRIAYNLRV